mgnify:FL=1
MELILLPALRVGEDVCLDALHIRLVEEDVFVVVALPDGLAIPGRSEFPDREFNAISVAPICPRRGDPLVPELSRIDLISETEMDLV